MKQYGRLLLALFLSGGAGAVGSLFTSSTALEWYGALNRSMLTSPDFVFGPVWTVLYILMGCALYRVWRLAHYRGDARKWTLVFLLHLFLNAGWSVVFFGFQNPLAALIVIALLWGFILWLMVRGWWIDHITGWILLPYFLWVTFATYLNIVIVLLN